MILEQLKAANIQALRDKNSNARAIFSVLLNKIKLAEIAKRETKTDLIESDIVAILQKTIKELCEEIDCFKKANYVDKVAEIESQKEILSQFLPSMLSSQEIQQIILSLPERSLPFVMKHFKSQYAGKCDMKLVQDTLKTL